MATRKQIAELAGVSQATVSRLLNGDAKLRITAQTRRRIMRAAAQLGYTAFTSRMIAVLNAPPEIDELQDAYFQSLREELRTAAEEQGPTLAFFASIDELIDAADDYDGFIAIGPATFTREQLGQLRRALPYGTFIDTNPAPTGSTRCARPEPDHARRARRTAGRRPHAHRLHRRHRRDHGPAQPTRGHPHACIHRLEPASASGQRRADLRQRTVHCRQWPRARRAHARTALPDALPDALVVASDPMAVGALQALAAASVRVPHDMAVVSVDNLPICQYTAPALSSFDIDRHELVYTALETLTDAIARDRGTRRHILISTKLICRASFQPPQPQ